MPLRILHISTRLILGGSQENTVLSCEGQARLGHDVHLAFGPIFGPEGSHLSRVHAFNTRCAQGNEPAKPITTHEIPTLVREVNPLKDRKARRALLELIERTRPDIVHTHSSKAGVLGRLAAFDAYERAVRGVGGSRAHRPAVVHTIHGPPFMPAPRNPVAKLKTSLKNKVYELAERHAASRCHAIVSVADAMTEQFLARNIGTPSLYTTVRSGMETEAFLTPRPGETGKDARRELGLAPTDFVIGTVARLAEHKGHDDLLDALAGTLRERRHWKLLWVGDGWWKDRLLRRVAQLGLEHQVVLTGLVSPERVPTMIRAMDVLAHPSAREGLPRTVPQALLCAVVPVAYDVDGTREVCIDQRTGRLVPAGNVQALADAIRWLHDHPGERRDMGERGREMCQTMFSTQGMVRGLEEVYAEALRKAERR
ncbi:MAG: glycosyltransferase family 1 protein [Phycisphaerales bacterium]|nr:MAG: glycosyltransferase family 1 protein [Phycisphaerales bacterium]